MTVYKKQIFPLSIRDLNSDLFKALNYMDQNMNDLFDRGLSVRDNFDMSLVDYVSNVTPGVETAVAHGLGKIPTGYIVYGQNAAGSIYDGTSTNTNATLYLRSSVGSVTFRILVF